MKCVGRDGVSRGEWMNEDGIILEPKQVRVGMFLVDVSLGMPYNPPTGLIVTGLDPKGFNARDDRCHNVYFYEWSDLPHLRLFIDERSSDMLMKLRASVAHVNWCLLHDRDGEDSIP